MNCAIKIISDNSITIQFDTLVNLPQISGTKSFAILAMQISPYTLIKILDIVGKSVINHKINICSIIIDGQIIILHRSENTRKIHFHKNN